MSKYQIDPEVFRHDVAVNPNDLNRCFQEHASLFAFYAACHVEAMRLEGRAKVSMRMKEAKAAKDFRDAAIANKEKVTEAMIEQAVTLDTEVIKARLAYSEAEARTELARHTVEAFRQRRDMLIQMGADQRTERQGDLRMNSGQSAIEALRRHASA